MGQDLFYKNDNNQNLEEYIDNVSKELKEGLSIFKNSEDNIVTVFGSSRILDDNYFYTEATELGRYLAEAGYSILTGGGPGIMEATNKGAANAGGVTYGVTVDLPSEEKANQYSKNRFHCEHLFTRKVLLTNHVKGFVIMPGGFGTLDELFEVVTLVANNITYKVPIVLINKDFWGGLIDWLSASLLRNGLIRQDELNVISITNNVKEAVEIIKNSK